jgi:hypothetical protein
LTLHNYLTVAPKCHAPELFRRFREAAEKLSAAAVGYAFSNLLRQSCKKRKTVYIEFKTAVASGSSKRSFACARLALFCMVENASIAEAKDCKILVISVALGPSGVKAGCDLRSSLKAFDKVMSSSIGIEFPSQRSIK